MGELSDERLDLSERAMARRNEAGQAEACVLAATPLLTVTLERSGAMERRSTYMRVVRASGSHA